MYKGLSRAQLSYDYLHTNSTTHEFLFGALAELLDNARDACATKINIYSVADQSLRGGYMLCFLDDGQGMSPDEAYDIITFGRSTKKSTDSQLIGMYGNGLKSGSMRIGNDFILFTKKGPTLTCVFLSRTFHEAEHLDEIIVPMPTFDSQTKKPSAKTPREKEKHVTEMALILKYSPFKTEAQFMKEFDKIENKSGTLVIIYNLKLLDSGQPELDVKSDPYDIILSNPELDGNEESDDGLLPERKSFRAYASILYVEPRMRVYIQGRKVRTKRLVNTLYKPYMYKYNSARFKTRSEAEVKRSENDAKSAENRAREAESKAKNLELKYGSSTDKDQRAELRRAQVTAVELRKEAQLKKAIAERKTKSLRDPKQLMFVFGINIENRSSDGMFVYNCSRLIKMYQKVGPQVDGGVFCSGVVGVVDVPYLVLEPTHNKQDFADAKEYRHLQQAMGEHMLQYWKDLGIAQQGVTRFWESFGYTSPNWRDLPSADPKFVRKRASVVQTTLQCDLCLKWRILPFSTNSIGRVYPDDWVCSMNTDPARNRCSAAEEKLNITEGVLKKTVKTKEQKEKELEEEIKRKQSQLQKIQKITPSSAGYKARNRSESEVEDDDGSDDSDVESGPPRPQSQRPRDTAKYHHSPQRSTAVYKYRSSVNDDRRHAVTYQSKSTFQRDTRSSKQKMTVLRSRPARRRGIADSDESSSKSASDADSVEEEPPSKRRIMTNKSAQNKQKTPSSSSATGKDNKHGSSSSDEEDDEEMPAVSESDMEVRVKAEVGTRVEILIDKKWLTGIVVDMNRYKDKWKILLDKQPDSFQWFDRNSPHIKILKAVQNESSETTDIQLQPSTVVESAAEAESQSTAMATADVATEAPSSSTVVPQQAALTNAVINEEIANGYRTCLRYFLPPQWIMDKDAVSSLNVSELAGFPLDDFFDHYEKGLRKLVSSFQQEAISKQQEADVAWLKLSNVRKMIAKLLKSMNDEFDIDAEADTDQVDELLSVCLKSALSQAKSDGSAS